MLPSRARMQIPLQCGRALSNGSEAAKFAAPNVVSIDEAKSMPRELKEYPNDVLLGMSIHGDHDACTERMIREIMSVNDVSWDAAQPYLEKVTAESRKNYKFSKLPYWIGIGGPVVTAAATFPLCFHAKTALWFNDAFVTEEVAKPEDLETILEVGTWTWNWMEPPLGQVSFVLLCLQFARGQMQNIGVKPYTGWWMGVRARRLQTTFPQYNARILADYANTDFSSGGA